MASLILIGAVVLVYKSYEWSKEREGEEANLADPTIIEEDPKSTPKKSAFRKFSSKIDASTRGRWHTRREPKKQGLERNCTPPPSYREIEGLEDCDNGTGRYDYDDGYYHERKTAQGISE